MKAEIATIAEYIQKFQNLSAKYPDFMTKVDAKSREKSQIRESTKLVKFWPF